MEPDEGAPANQRTDVPIVYGDQAIYVAAMLYDTGSTTTILAHRDAVLERLEARLDRSGVKGFVTRSGFPRFLRVTDEEVTMDREKVERDARHDGLWVLDTSTDLPAAELAVRLIHYCARPSPSAISPATALSGATVAPSPVHSRSI